MENKRTLVHVERLSKHVTGKWCLQNIPDYLASAAAFGADVIEVTPEQHASIMAFMRLRGWNPNPHSVLGRELKIIQDDSD